MKERWRLYGVSMAGVLVVAGLVSWFMPTDLLKGMVLGAVLVFGPGALWVVTLQVTGTAPVMMGDQAEQWTASELRKLTRRGWRLVNHFALGRDDIDHVLIGPGGAFAVETKWSATSWRSDYAGPRLRDAVNQAQRNARVLRLWHPFKSRGVPVHPVLVLWGGGAAERAERQRIRVIDGVTVIAGLAVRDWSEQLGEGVLEESAVTGSWAEVSAHIGRRDPHDKLEHPQPASLAELAGRAGWAIGAAIGGFLLFGRLLQWSDSVPWTVALSLTALAPSLALLKVGIARHAAWGWTLSLSLSAVGLAVAELIYRLA